MAPYDVDNNPYIPGDPASYDLSWITERLTNERFSEDYRDQAKASAEAAANSAAEASGYADDAEGYKNDASGYADDASGYADDAEGYRDEAADYAAHIADPVSGLVTSWLTDHITNPSSPPIDTSLLVAGAAADAKAVGDKLYSIKNIDPIKLTFVSGTAYGNVGSSLVAAAATTRCRIWKASILGFEVVARTGYQFCVLYTDAGGIITSKSPDWITSYIIPTTNTDAVTVVARKIGDGAISPTEAEDNILFSQPIIEEFSIIDSSMTSLTNRLIAIDGQLIIDPDDFVIGALSITNSGWAAVASNKRVSSDPNSPISLNAGDRIKLTDYSTANFYIGYRRADNTYATPGAWLGTDYICPEDGDYVITIKNVPSEIVLSSKEELLDLLQIIDKDALINQIENLSSGLFDVPALFNGTQVYTEAYGNTKAVQGLCTDGTYLYQAVMEQLGNEGAGTTIKKIQVSDMSLVDSDTGIYGHCNDLCYYPDDNYIIAIYKNSLNYNVVTRFNASTLAKIDDIDLSSMAASIGSGLTFVGITYAADIDRFIIAVQSGYSLVGFAFVKTDWTLEKYIKVIPQTYVMQCIDYKDSVIYAAIHRAGIAERVFAYDMHGNIINYTENTFGYEIEGIAHINDTFYMSYNPSSYQALYIYQADPVNTYISMAKTLAKYNLNY